MSADKTPADTGATPPPTHAAPVRPDRWTVSAAMLGSLLLLCVAIYMEGRTSTVHFLIGFGPFYAVAWLAGVLFASSLGRWFAIAWALLGAYLFIDVLITLDMAEARGGIRCGNLAFHSMLWTICLPPCMLFIAWRNARYRKTARDASVVSGP